MTEIHNAELTQEVVIGSVAAWLEQTNDSILSIEVAFQRDLTHTSNQDLIATTRIDILKGEDFRPMNRGKHMWNGEDQKIIEKMQRKRPEVKGKTTVGLVKESVEKTKSKSKSISNEPEKKKVEDKSKKWSDKVEKKVAVKWEIPSAEYYPVRYDERIIRNPTAKKQCAELQTAQEAPAIRERGDANDRTDQDCLTHPRDLHSSKESLSSQGSTQRESSPERKQETPVEPPVKPIEEIVPEKIPEKIPEEPKKEEEVKKVEEVKKLEEVKPEEPKKEEPKVEEVLKKLEDPPPKVEEIKKVEEVKKEEEIKKEDPPKKEEEVVKKEEPIKEDPPKKIEEKKEEPKKEDLPKKIEEKNVVEEKKEVANEEPPVVIVEEKKPKKKIQMNVKRFPDMGELTILSENNGMVTFSCSTRHRNKKAKKSEK